MTEEALKVLMNWGLSEKEALAWLDNYYQTRGA